MLALDNPVLSTFFSTPYKNICNNTHLTQRSWRNCMYCTKQEQELVPCTNYKYWSKTPESSITAILRFFFCQGNSFYPFQTSFHKQHYFFFRWRFQSAATRDHALSSAREFSTSDSNRTPPESESWHDELCSIFISEYKRYLQTLGFNMLQVETTTKR